ncbi:MAG TPA: hypothetical protein VIW68_04700 [Candidatus Sulfotelmatobacter sp.]
MAEVIQHAEQEFWQPPAVLHAVDELQPASPVPAPGEACQHCATEFLVGAHFCHACGTPRVQPSPTSNSAYSSAIVYLVGGTSKLRSMATEVSWPKVVLPAWVQYLHFHQIKRWIALPTASLIAFLIGLGCVAGAIGVSLVYKPQNFADFQAIQMWRIEWLLAATASFVAGILLKKPSNGNNDNEKDPE